MPDDCSCIQIPVLHSSVSDGCPVHGLCGTVKISGEYLNTVVGQRAKLEGQAAATAAVLDEEAIRADERHRVNMTLNTQKMSRRIDDCIEKGGDGGAVLNLFADFLRGES